MSPPVVEGFVGNDTPVLFDVRIGAYWDFDQAMANPTMRIRDEYEVKAIIDTGSRQCLIVPGLFANRHFGTEPRWIDLEDSNGNVWHCQGQNFFITFQSGIRTKTIEVPVYEHRISRWPAGTLLIGRTILDHAVFTYDGPGKKASLTFTDDSEDMP